MSKSDTNTYTLPEGCFFHYLDYLYVEIGLLPEDIETVPLSGRADSACAIIANKDYVAYQLANFSEDALFDAVRKLCDNPELNNRTDAIKYIVWITACNIKEEPEWEEYIGPEEYVITIPSE